MKAFLTVGVSASGKTTWATRHARMTGALITNRDDLRFSLTGARTWHDYKFDRRVEAIVTSVQSRILESNAATIRRDVVIADTNLHGVRRLSLEALCQGMGYKTVIVPFPITLDLAIRRDAARAGLQVGAAVIEKQYEQWLEFEKGST